MEWLDIDDESNPDIEPEFIGNLIMKDGFKARYRNVEVFSDQLRNNLIKLYEKHGYAIEISYNSNFINCEITAIKKRHPYLEAAAVISVLWVIYRVYIHTV